MLRETKGGKTKGTLNGWGGYLHIIIIAIIVIVIICIIDQKTCIILDELASLGSIYMVELFEIVYCE